MTPEQHDRKVTISNTREVQARLGIQRRLADKLGCPETTPCDHDVSRTRNGWPNWYRYTAVMYCHETGSHATASGTGPTTLNATLAALARLTMEVSR